MTFAISRALTPDEIYQLTFKCKDKACDTEYEKIASSLFVFGGGDERFNFDLIYKPGAGKTLASSYGPGKTINIFYNNGDLVFYKLCVDFDSDGDVDVVLKADIMSQPAKSAEYYIFTNLETEGKSKSRSNVNNGINNTAVTVDPGDNYFAP